MKTHITTYEQAINSMLYLIRNDLAWIVANCSDENETQWVYLAQWHAFLRGTL